MAFYALSGPTRPSVNAVLISVRPRFSENGLVPIRDTRPTSRVVLLRRALIPISIGRQPLDATLRRCDAPSVAQSGYAKAIASAPIWPIVLPRSRSPVMGRYPSRADAPVVQVSTKLAIARILLCGPAAPLVVG